MMIRSFITGILRASRSWKMILFLLVANLLFTIPIVVPIFLLIVQTSSGTLAANNLFADKIDLRWLTDVFNHQMAGVSLESIGIQVGTLLIVMGLSYLLLNTFFSGGIIRAFWPEDGQFKMADFWLGCGAYFWRFFRLLLISMIFYGAALVIFFLLRRAIDRMTEHATAYETVFLGRWAIILLLILFFAFINMVFDYAKIGAVFNDSRIMFRETFRALRFALRHFFSAFGLYLLITILGLSIFLVLARLRGSLNQSSVAAVFIAILLGQLAIAFRMWARLVLYAAEMDFYQRVRPASAPFIIPTEPPVEVEFLTAERPEPGNAPDNFSPSTEEQTVSKGE
jgi:hypothetical protein